MSQNFRDGAEIFRILKRLLYFYVKNYAINSATAGPPKWKKFKKVKKSKKSKNVKEKSKEKVKK